MSLYFVYASNINNREVDSIFFFDVNNDCYIKHNDEVSPIYKEINNIDINIYKDIVKYAEDNKYSSYEIMFFGEGKTLEAVIKYLSKYLIDKDLSIGLLSDNKDLVDKFDMLFEIYGVTTPYIRVNHTASYLYELLSPTTRCNISDESEVEGILPKCPLPNKKAKFNFNKINTIELDESFHDKFIKYLIESGKDNVEIYKKAGISRQVFSKILSDKNTIPTKLTVISLCIGLELSLKEAKELLEASSIVKTRTKKCVFFLIFEHYLLYLVCECILNQFVTGHIKTP